MREILSRYDYIILDACCAINLYASGKMENILQAIPCQFAIADYVSKVEVKDIFSSSSTGTERTREPINLTPLIDNELLIITNPQSEEEWLSIINYQTYDDLDKGEAYTGAIAKHRNWCVCIDDLKGTNVFANESPPIATISTPEIIKYWVDITKPTGIIINETLQNIKNQARYEPGRKHHLYLWWQNHKKQMR